VFEAVHNRLVSRDQDQNVKLACISTSGIIIQHHGLGNLEHVTRLLPIIIERLASDTMRVSVLKSLTQSFAAGPSCIRCFAHHAPIDSTHSCLLTSASLFRHISVTDVLPPIISHAVTFAKHVDLILRHELFTCMTSMLHNHLPGVTDSVRPSLCALQRV
jgi:hypothetical protein